MADYRSVPQILKDFPNWIVWKLESRKGKETKVPYSIDGGFAKSNDSSTWTTFEKAAWETDTLNGSDYDGIGFMLQGTSLVGIDFDGVVTDGTPELFVLAILDLLGNPYSEITPSGKGLRCFVECAALPEGQRKFSADHYGAEIYIGCEGGRYLTVTGEKYSGDGVPKIADLSIPYLLISQIRNEKFKRLWLSDSSEFGNDQSRGDLALLGLLSRILQTKDPEVLTRIFNASGPGHREKWLERPDYRKRTLKKLLSGKKPERAESSDDWVDSEPQARPSFEAAPPVPVFRLADEVNVKVIRWFWKERIPLGKITLFVGNPDNGKSLASTWIAASCTTGRDFPDAPNPLPPSEVLMLLGEDDIEDTAVPRLMAAGANRSKIHLMEAMRFTDGDERDIRLDQDLKAIEARLDANPDIRLIVIDPISNYLGDVSMIAEQEVRSLMIPIKRLAAARSIAVLVVMHLNKKSDLEAISRVGGAMAFIGVARASWLFIRDAKEENEDGSKKSEPDTFSMLKIKNNLARSDKNGMSYTIKVTKLDLPGFEEEFTPYLDWVGTVEHSADEALGGRGAKREAHRPAGTDTHLQAAMRWLQNKLQGGPQPQKSILEHAKNEADIAEKTLRRAKQALGVKAYQIARGWQWELPAANATLPAAVSIEGADQDEDDTKIQRDFDVQ